MIYRHFIRTDDGAICELEEGLQFSIDEHQLLESWPTIPRKLLASESRLIEESKEEVREPTKRSDIFGDISNEPIMRASPSDESGLQDSEPIAPEPEVILVKND